MQGSKFNDLMRGFLVPISALKLIWKNPRLILLMVLSALFLYPRGLFTTMNLVKMCVLIFLDLALAHCVIDALDGGRVSLRRGLSRSLSQWFKGLCLFGLYIGVDYALFHYGPLRTGQGYSLFDGILDHFVPIALLFFVIVVASNKKEQSVSLSEGIANILSHFSEVIGFIMMGLPILATLIHFFPHIHNFEFSMSTAYMGLLIGFALMHRVIILTFGLKLYRGGGWGGAYRQVGPETMGQPRILQSTGSRRHRSF